MQDGLWATIVAWFKFYQQHAGAWIQTAVSVIEGDVQEAILAVEPDAVAAFDALFGQLKTAAVAMAGEVEKAVMDGTLLNSEARSALFAKLLQEAETLGYSAEQQGLTSALNLLTEFGVTMMKLITGSAIKHPAKK